MTLKRFFWSEILSERTPLSSRAAKWIFAADCLVRIRLARNPREAELAVLATGRHEQKVFDETRERKGFRE